MNNDEVIKQNVKRIDLKIKDLKMEISDLLALINNCKCLDYFDIDSLQKLNKQLLEKLEEIKICQSNKDMIVWTFKKLEE